MATVALGAHVLSLISLSAIWTSAQAEGVADVVITWHLQSVIGSPPRDKKASAAL
jgi:hypothetical protein